MCTLVSIDVDLVYSVDRRFQLTFELLNELDVFNGTNQVTITIVENGKSNTLCIYNVMYIVTKVHNALSIVRVTQNL